MRWANKEIFEIDAVLGLPGREVEKPDRHADNFAIYFDEVAEGSGLITKEGDRQRFDRGLDSIELAFVLGEVSYKGEDCVAVSDGGPSNVHRSTLGSEGPEAESRDSDDYLLTGNTLKSP